ncbi:hypothetical protein Peur_017241 [Populus x canadensis]
MTWHITKTSSLLSTLPPLLPFPSVSFMAVSRIRVSAPSWEILVPEYERALVELITPAKNQSLPPLSLNAYQTEQIDWLFGKAVRCSVQKEVMA